MSMLGNEMHCTDSNLMRHSRFASLQNNPNGASNTQKADHLCTMVIFSTAGWQRMMMSGSKCRWVVMTRLHGIPMPVPQSNHVKPIEWLSSASMPNDLLLVKFSAKT